MLFESLRHHSSMVITIVTHKPTIITTRFVPQYTYLLNYFHLKHTYTSRRPPPPLYYYYVYIYIYIYIYIDFVAEPAISLYL